MWFLVIFLGSLVVCAIVIFLRSRASDTPLLVNTKPPELDVTPVDPLVDAPSDASIESTSLPIDQIRLTLDDPPRNFSKAMQSYLHIEPPKWMSR